MAIGACRREVAFQFLIEAALLALLGSAIDVGVGLCGAAAFGAGAALERPEMPAVVLAAVAAAILITLVSAHCLARRATRLDPADALTPL